MLYYSSHFASSTPLKLAIKDVYEAEDVRPL